MLRLLSVVTFILFLAACGSAPPAPAALSLISVSPQGEGVAVDSVVGAVFDGPLALPYQSGLQVTRGGVPVAGQVSYDPESFTLTFTPADRLEHATAYDVTLAASLSEAADLSLTAARGWHFRTIAAAGTDPHAPGQGGDGLPDDTDPTPTPGHETPGTGGSGGNGGTGNGGSEVIAPNTPYVVATDPRSGQTGVPVDWTLAVQFSHPMDEASFTSSSFSLSVDGAAVPGFLDYDAETNTAYFGPEAALRFGTRYTVTLSGHIRGASGTPLAQAVSWSFTTETEAERENPADPDRFRILSRSASNGVVTVAFNQPLDPASLTSGVLRVKRAKGGWLKGSVSYREVTVSGRTQYLLEFAPAAPLGAGRTYRVMLKGSVAAQGGGVLGQTHTWFFVAD